MPLVPSDYKPPFLFRNGHFSTIFAGVIRRVNGLVQQRERLELDDGDFMDLDWSESVLPTKKLVIILHGLEGDAQRHYIIGSAQKLNLNGFDACAVNFRGCSGEDNRHYKSYHSGATDDLARVVDHVNAIGKYEELYLLGFSLGGNMSLKFVGESPAGTETLKAVVAVSVPCDLKDACDQLLQSKNVLYSARFKKHLLAKLRKKQERFPDMISKEAIKRIRTLKDFDDTYTAPAHGFENALDYYAKCSSNQFLPHIKVPSLILNAKNDSFLGEKCYPYEISEANTMVHLEVPEFGGHVGFWGKKNISYAEERALQFFESVNP